MRFLAAAGLGTVFLTNSRDHAAKVCATQHDNRLPSGILSGFYEVASVTSGIEAWCAAGNTLPLTTPATSTSTYHGMYMGPRWHDLIRECRSCVRYSLERPLPGPEPLN
jgi:hypothetical protein